ncbi:MAG: hypothetical protein RL291_370 [Pseudomonadota bacterium]
MTRHKPSQRIVFASLTIAAALVTSVPAQASDVKPIEVAIATATPGGVYFAAGNAICRILSRETVTGTAAPISCLAAPTTGSVGNLDNLRRGIHSVALVQSDWVHRAANGMGRFGGRKTDNLRALFGLHREAFHILAARGSEIRSWRDLKGKRVAIGMPSTVHRLFFDEMLRVHGQDKSIFAQAAEFPLGEQVQRLCDSEVEAIGMVTGVPSTVLAGAIRRCGGALVPLDTAEVDRYIYAQPYLAPMRIDGQRYGTPGISVPTFAVVATAITTADLPDEIAYRIVRNVFENLEAFKAMHPALADLDPKAMIKDGLSVPLHPGALRYYVEAGLMERPLTAEEIEAKRARDQAAALLSATQPFANAPNAPAPAGASPAQPEPKSRPRRTQPNPF